MEIAYICSPYRNNPEENTKLAKTYCLHALRQGYVPLAPHLLFTQILNDNDPTQRRMGLQCGLTLLKKCDAVFVYGDRISSGMQREIIEAERLNKSIYYMDSYEAQLSERHLAFNGACGENDTNVEVTIGR